jgi:hypothetical protein
MFNIFILFTGTIKIGRFNVVGDTKLKPSFNFMNTLNGNKNSGIPLNGSSATRADERYINNIPCHPSPMTIDQIRAKRASIGAVASDYVSYMPFSVTINSAAITSVANYCEQYGTHIGAQYSISSSAGTPADLTNPICIGTGTTIGGAGTPVVNVSSNEYYDAAVVTFIPPAGTSKDIVVPERSVGPATVGGTMYINVQYPGWTAGTIIVTGVIAVYKKLHETLQTTGFTMLRENLTGVALEGQTLPIWTSDQKSDIPTSVTLGRNEILASMTEEAAYYPRRDNVSHFSPLPSHIQKAVPSYPFDSRATIIEIEVMLPQLKRAAAIPRISEILIIDLSEYNRWLRCVESIVATGYNEALATAWNKLMHCINGNTQMVVQPQMSPEEREARLAHIRNPQSRNFQRDPSDIPDQATIDKRRAFAQRQALETQRQLEEFKKAVAEEMSNPASKGVTVPKTEDEQPVALPKRQANQKLIELIITQRVSGKHLLEYEGKLVVFVCDLEITDAELESIEDEGVQLPRNETQRPSSPISSGSSAGNRPGRKPKEASLREQDNKRREEEAFASAQNFNASVERIAKKICEKPKGAVRWYREHPESKDFRRLVLEKAWGKTWMSAPQMSSTQWVIYCAINNVSKDLCFIQLMECFPEWNKTLEEYDISQAWHDTFGTDWVQTSAVLKAERDRHNKEVHAENGNTAICRVMEEVQKNPRSHELYRSGAFSKQLGTLKGSMLSLKLATQPSSTNPTQLNNQTNSAIRADVIANTNVITNDVSLNIPNTALVPREVRNGAAAVLINATQRLPIKVLGPTQFVATELTDTDLQKTIVEAAIKANMNLGRADNTCLNGFNAIDLAFQGRLKAYYGLCMDQCLAKLVLLHEVLSWAQPYNTLPITSASVIDQFTQPNATGPTVLGYNDSPVFGEDCGGATSVLPFEGGETGTIAFHLTTETVPVEERSQAVFIPASLLLMDESVNVGQALAFFINMWAPYPVGLPTVSIPTLDTAGGNALNQVFVHLASLVQIPGLTTLHVILPRKTTAPNPDTQAKANNLAILQPITGSAASTGLAANTDLNVNYVNGPYTSYNMAEYFYTWFPDFDATSLANFIQRLSYITGVDDSLRRVNDIASMVSQAFPPLTADTSATNTRFAANSNAQFYMSNAASIQFYETTQNWPQAGNTRADYLINATDVTGWNKVACGLAVSSEGIVDNFILPEYLGNVNAAYWSQLRSLMFAVVWSSHYANVGWSADTWDTAYSNNTMPDFRALVRKYYAVTNSSMREQQNAAFGPMLADYFAAITNKGLGYCTRGNSNITIFDQMCPPTGVHNTVTDNTGTWLDMAIPIVVPDVWMQLMAECLPMWQCSFPVPNGPDSAVGFHKGLRAVAIPGSANIGGLVQGEYYRQTIDGNEGADWADEVRWNERLIHVSGYGTPTYLNDAAVASTLAAGEYAKQRYITQPSYIPTIATGVQAANTMVVPNVDSDGQQVFQIGTTVNLTLMRRILYGQSRQAIPTWQLGNSIAWNDLLNQSSAQSTSRWTNYEKKPVPGKADSSSTQPEQGEDKTSEI